MRTPKLAPRTTGWDLCVYLGLEGVAQPGDQGNSDRFEIKI
jgi:hypothetical protein